MIAVVEIRDFLTCVPRHQDLEQMAGHLVCGLCSGGNRLAIGLQQSTAVANGVNVGDVGLFKLHINNRPNNLYD